MPRPELSRAQLGSEPPPIGFREAGETTHRGFANQAEKLGSCALLGRRTRPKSSSPKHRFSETIPRQRRSSNRKNHRSQASHMQHRLDLSRIHGVHNDNEARRDSHKGVVRA